MKSLFKLALVVLLTTTTTALDIRAFHKSQDEKVQTRNVQQLIPRKGSNKGSSKGSKTSSPTVSISPSSIPTVSMNPTLTLKTAKAGSKGKGTSAPTVSANPSANPTLSMMPTVSMAPTSSKGKGIKSGKSAKAGSKGKGTSAPTVSNAPSSNPTLSMMPTVSSAPSRSKGKGKYSKTNKSAKSKGSPTPAPIVNAAAPGEEERNGYNIFSHENFEDLCVDSTTYRFEITSGKRQKCTYITSKKKKKRQELYCKGDTVKECCKACEGSDEKGTENSSAANSCVDRKAFKFNLNNGNTVDCSWVAKANAAKRKSMYCRGKVKRKCCESCS